MTPIETIQSAIKEMREARAKATQGEITIHRMDKTCGAFNFMAETEIGHGEDHIVAHFHEMDNPNSKNNAAFFALSCNRIEAILSAMDVLVSGLEFYGDDEKYFMRKSKINLQETTAVFKVEDPSKLPTDYESNVFDCSARLKVDQGKTAKEALNRAAELLTKETK